MSTSTFDLDAYRAEIRVISNRELVQRVGGEVLDAAVMAGFSRFNDGVSDARCDALSAEARRRGNPDLYVRGFNDAVRSQGHNGMVEEVSTPIDVGDPTNAACA